MSTAISPPSAMAEAAQLYRPRVRGLSMGSRLQEMYRQGRQEIVAQRTRWQRNRAFFRGEQYLSQDGNHLVRQAPTQLLRSGRRRDTVNRLRPMVEGRVAMMTHQRPPFEVIPPGIDQDSIDGARLGAKLIRHEWSNVRGWNVQRFLFDWLLAAEQDGLAFGNVLWDTSRNSAAPLAERVDQQTGQFVPVENRAELEALRSQDPEARVLWRMVEAPAGRVVMRVVRANWLSIDPNMTTDWGQADYVIESRVRPREDVERQIGRPLDDLVRLSDRALGRAQPTKPAPVTTEIEGQLDRIHDPSRQVLVHEAFIVAGGELGEWPLGAHLMWADQAPAAPFLAEPWLDHLGRRRELPYYPLVPRTDGGHLLRAIGTVEELAPIQVVYNRTQSQIGEWMDLVARPPLILHGGSLRSESVFNEKRIVLVNPGFSEPRFMTVPTEPTALLTNRLMQLEHEMSEVSMQSNASRGQPPGGGVEAFVAIQQFIQQDEQSMSGTENAFRQGIEWAVGEALTLTQMHLTTPQLVTQPGVDDEEELTSFVGEKLRGATRFLITGSVLPRQRAQQLSMLFQFMQVAGPRFDPTPFAAEILEGNVDYIITAERQQQRRQAAENRDMARLGAREDRDQLWTEFTAMRDAYAKLMGQIMGRLQQQMLATGIAPPLTPQQMMEQAGIRPPKVLDLLRKAGVTVPSVEDTDIDTAHVNELRQFATSDGFRRYHPLVQQALREHLHEHIEHASRNVMAMGRQMPTGPSMNGGAGSPPAPKGQAPQAKPEPLKT